MISRSYIHEYAPHDQFMCESYYLLLESKDTLNDLIKLENIITEKEYFGESVENEILVLEAEKKNIFTRIGETIINIFNSFIDLLKDTGNAIKDALTGARKKSSDDKFQDAMRKNPQLAQDFLQGVMSGNIKAHDVKDLNKLLDEATKITNDLMNGKIDKKTFVEKVEGTLERFGTVAKNIASIFGVVTAIGGAVAAFDNLNTREEKRAREDRRWLDYENDRLDRAADRTRDAQDRARRISRENEADTRARAAESRAQEKHQDWQQHEKGRAKRESFLDEVQGDYITESVSFSDIFKKITTFFTDHVSFCTDAIKKLADLKDNLLDMTKNSKDSEDGEKVNVAVAGIQKIMGAISKELNAIRNLASKVENKCEA